MIFKYINIIKKISFTNYFLKFLFKIFSYIKKDDRLNILFESSNSIFNLWFLKRTLFTKKKLFEENLDINFNNFSEFYNDIEKKGNIYDFINPKIKISYLDSLFYMKNQLLRDSDWASMFHGIELRTPFVDAYLLSKLKDIMNNYSHSENKQCLKETFDKILPKQLLQSKKTGFQTPIKIWIESYFQKNSKNYLLNHMLDIRKLFNKY